MPEEAPMYCIRLVFADDQKNGVTTIGGAAWPSQQAQQAAWDDIPVLPEGTQSAFLADLLAENGDIIADKSVSAETCEALMGKPIATLIEEGRKNTCYTLADFKSKHPELFDTGAV